MFITIYQQQKPLELIRFNTDSIQKFKNESFNEKNEKRFKYKYKI